MPAVQYGDGDINFQITRIQYDATLFNAGVSGRRSLGPVEVPGMLHKTSRALKTLNSFSFGITALEAQ